MTQDNDDLLAQVFSVIPSLDQNHHEHHEINGNTIKDDNMHEIAANVRRVSNAFQDFLDKSGVVETHFESVTENHHSESHFQVMTTHVETHHEVVTNHHEEHHIGGGATIEHHTTTIGNGASIQEEHHSIGHGVSLIGTEQLPSVIENHDFSIGHGAEVTMEHQIGQGAAIVHEEHNGIGHGAVPHDAVQNYAPLGDDQESVISAHTAISEATSVSVHSSVSQKSVQLYADAPVQLPSAHQSVISHHSASTVKESRHSDVTHTHDKESTISLSSVQSKNSEKTLTGSHASGHSQGTTVNNYVFVEKTDVVEAGSEISTPVAPLKSAPHDALIEEFKQLHPRQPSEVSIPPPPTSSPPPLDDEETASEVVMTVRVTEFEFDSNHVKNSMTVEHKESHHHSEEHHEEHFHDHHHVEQDSHVAIGEGAQIHHDHVIGEGVQLKGVHHLDSEDEFKFEEVEYVHENNTHHIVGNVVEKAASVVSSVVAKSDPPPVFFQSPVLHRRVPSNVASHVDSSSDDETIHGSQHGAGHHHHHHHHEHHEHDLQRDLIPNVSGPYVRDEPRPVHVAEEYRTTTTVVKTVSAPIAHVSPVISQEKGVPKIDHREHLTPMVETAPVVHKIVEETHTHHEDHHSHHHEHHHHHHHHESTEKDYHKHDEQLEEVFSGPSVRDLKSKFEQGGKVEIHYTTHYISHQNQPRQNHEEVHLHHVEHEHHTHEHEHALHEHNHHEHQHEQHIHHEHSHHDHHHDVSQHDNSAFPHLPHRETHNHVDIHHEHEVEHQQHHETEHKHHHHHHHEAEHKHHHHHHHHHHGKARTDSHHHHHHHHEHAQHQQQVQQVQQEVHVHEELHHQEYVHVHQHEEHHHHHEDEHHETETEHAVEEEQLPVSLLLSKYGGGAKLRRPDHVEEIKIYSRKSTLQNIGDGAAPVVQQVVEPLTKSRTVTQSSVSTKQARSESTFSVQSSQQRSHASTLTQNHHEAVQQVAVTPIVAAAPVAAARSSSSDHQSVRVVKSVRAFVNQWGQKDFKPPTSPVITVPRLPSSPRQDKEFFPEPISRKSTVTSQVNNVVAQEHHDYNANEKTERAHSVAYSEAHSVRSEAKSIAASQATSVSKSCENCSICGKNMAQSKASSKRPSVASEASTVTTTTYSVHKTPAAFVEETTTYAENTGYANQPIPEVHEEFVLTPLAERRALFEHGVNRGYSIRRNLHGELRPMVNVFTD